MDWLKYKKIYFLLSGILISFGMFSLAVWGLPLGIDFTGGTLAEYRFVNEISTGEITQKLQSTEVQVASIQKTQEGSYLLKLQKTTPEDKEKINAAFKETIGEGNFEELKFETVGPSIGPELVKKTIYAIAIAAGAILIWVAIQFKSLKFGSSAILAMLHDSLILIGFFSIAGHFFGAELDFLLVTALLTTLSFSVHDTIVVYDRIREKQKKGGDDFTTIANSAITETMVRSLNNSFTIVFMLMALILLGGGTIKWFALALLVGTLSGTYSSPFVAVPILDTWNNLFKEKGEKRKLRKLRIPILSKK